jgi:transposase
MEKPVAISIEPISQADWDSTPLSVRQVVADLTNRITQLEVAQQELQGAYELLQEQVKLNSTNSSQPPSKDRFKDRKPNRKTKSAKPHGGQAGHVGHDRPLYPVEMCEPVFDHYPEVCWQCGQALSGEDPAPFRAQVIEIPPIAPQITEHRVHQLVCAHCQAVNRADCPEVYRQSGYGERVVAHVALLSGIYRQSHRLVQQLLWDCFGVEIAVGTVQRLRQEASLAVAAAVDEVQQYVQSSPVVGVDETGFKQGNLDGQNPQQRKGWLWVVVTPLVTFFQVCLSRSQIAAQSVLGRNFDGIVISDRCGSYNWIDRSQRQLCWAHLKRDFIAIAERSGVSKALGEALLEQEKQLFQLWYQVRDGTLSRVDFIAAVEPIRARVKALLEQGANYPIAANAKTPLAKTVRTCANLLKFEPALWTFVTIAGVEPTNNDSERSLRPAVIWRQLSFGAQSQAGSRFVSRMLTVVTTLQAQDRSVLEYLVHAVRAARQNQPSPSLLPD